MSQKPSAASVARQRAWETRRAHRPICVVCNRQVAQLYSAPDIHEARDLCIDCAWAVAERAAS